MTGFANKLNEPFSVPQPKANSASGTGASSQSVTMRTAKSSIHDLEAWLPVRRTSGSVVTSVATACVITASPSTESTHSSQMIPTETMISTDSNATISPVKPDLKPAESPDTETIRKETGSTAGYLDIPFLECSNIFETT